MSVDIAHHGLIRSTIYKSDVYIRFATTYSLLQCLLKRLSLSPFVYPSVHQGTRDSIKCRSIYAIEDDEAWVYNFN